MRLLRVSDVDHALPNVAHIDEGGSDSGGERGAFAAGGKDAAFARAFAGILGTPDIGGPSTAPILAVRFRTSCIGKGAKLRRLMQSVAEGAPQTHW